MLKYPSIAVDFDDTLGYSTEEDYPKISYINKYAVNVLNEYKAKGGVCILWTCRSGIDVDIVVDELKKYGLEFDAVNKNTDEINQAWLKNHPDAQISPKISVSLYIDDRNYGLHDHKLDWKQIKKEILKEY